MTVNRVTFGRRTTSNYASNIKEERGIFKFRGVIIPVKVNGGQNGAISSFNRTKINAEIANKSGLTQAIKETNVETPKDGEKVWVYKNFRTTKAMRPQQRVTLAEAKNVARKANRTRLN